MPPIVKNPQTVASRSAAHRATTTSKPRSLAGDRPVVYPDYGSKWCVGNDALTLTKIDKILGWVEETPDKPFGDDYLFIFNGVKIRCLNNIRNRPIYWHVVRALVQEHLHGKWRANGETIILGRTGLVLNGQHTLIAAKVAEWERTNGPDADYWRSIHPDPVTVEKLVATGVEETDEVINTMDTCKPRTLADVVYRSSYFKTLKPKERVTVSRMMDHAITFLWDRTGAKHDAYAPRRTHAEALDFLARHPKVEDAVCHIWEEYQASWAASSKWMSPGRAAAILYMMTTSRSSQVQIERYRKRMRSAECSQSDVDMGMWDKACEFWTMFRADAPEMAEVRKVISSLSDPTESLGTNSQDERTGVMAMAWSMFKDDLPIRTGSLQLEYRTDVNGNREGLAVSYTFGGIDRGNKTVRPRGTDDRTANGNGDSDVSREKVISIQHQHLASQRKEASRQRQSK